MSRPYAPAAAAVPMKTQQGHPPQSPPRAAGPGSGYRQSLCRMLGDVTHTHTLPTPSLLQVTQPPWSDWGEERRGLIHAKAKALRLELGFWNNFC